MQIGQVKTKTCNSLCLIILGIFFPMFFSMHVMNGEVFGCPACWAGYGPGAERYNKALADLRIMYENEGKEALPEIHKILLSTLDPLVQQRAADYIAEQHDTEAIPLLESVLYELIKRVSFSTFGVTTFQFKTRLRVAHTLVKLGNTDLTEKIRQRYDRMDITKKSEVPYILNALEDPNLTEFLLMMLDKEEDHQVIMSTLDVLAMGGDETAVPALRHKAAQWGEKYLEVLNSPESGSSVTYSIWKIKAKQAVLEIEKRAKN